MSVIGSNALAGASGQGGGDFVIEKSLRFKKDADASLTRTPTTAGSQSAFTLSTWVKRSLSTTYEYLMWTTTSFYINFTSGDKLNIALYAPDGSSWAVIATSQARFRDPSAWYHIVVSVDSSAGTTNADRLKLWVNGVESPLDYATYWGSLITGNISEVNTTIEHEIGARSSYPCDFYLAEYYWIDGQGLTQNDFGAYDDNNVWQPKKFTGTYGTNGFHLDFSDNSSNSAIGTDSSGNGNDWTVNNLNSGASTKPKWYTSTTLYTTKADVIANATDRGQAGFTLSSAEYVYLVPNDGGTPGAKCHPASSTYPATFYTYSIKAGDSNWVNTGSFGSNEAALHQWDNTTNDSAYDFSNAEDLYLIGDTRVGGLPTAGASMTGSFPALVNTVIEPDVLRDSPTNGSTDDDTGAGGEVSGNYCTWSSLAGTNVTLSNGNLDCSLSAGTTSKARATIAVTSGKYYWEITYKSGQYGMIGISDASLSGSQISYAAGALNYYVLSGTLYGDLGGSFSNTSYGSALSANDVIGVALDMDNGNVKFYKNGSDLGNANTFSLVGKTIMPHLNEAGGATFVTEANFGARSFVHSAPSGYKALCTANLPTPTIADGSDYFDAKLYTGTEATLTVSGYEFSPDLVWRKGRQAVSGSITESPNHLLFDTVRGAGKKLMSNDAAAEDTGSTTLTAFTSDGFTLGNSTDGNDSPQTYVAWAWEASDSTVSNTDGDVTSSVRANQSAGFSIVKWNPSSNGQSVAHGLNAVPEFIMAKALDNGHSWRVYHKSLSSGKNLLLDGYSSEDTYSADIDTVSSTVFDGGQGLTGSSLNNNIAYCFTSVEGYSSFGKFKGNGSADGPFVYIGFRPAFILTKGIDDAEDWYIRDTSLSPFNKVDKSLRANDSGSEYSGRTIDILSNGFKIRDADTQINENGKSYLYVAFAENPFQANGGLAR